MVRRFCCYCSFIEDGWEDVLVWVLWEADAKMGLNIQGFNKGSAVAGSSKANLTVNRGKGGRILGVYIPIAMPSTEVHPDGQGVLEWKSAVIESYVTQEQACLGIPAVYSRWLGPAWRKYDLSENRSWISDRSSGVSFVSCSWSSARWILMVTPGKMVATQSETSGSWRSERSCLWQIEADSSSGLLPICIHTCMRSDN